MTNSEKTKLQKEIVDLLDRKPHGRLLLAPRSGKTKLVIDLIKRDNPESILWVTPLAELAINDIPQEFITWKAKKFLKRLRTVTWTSLNTVEGHYSTIIFDEEQFITENNISNIINGKLTYDNIVSVTGTRTKHESKNELYDRLNLPILYELDINDAVDMGILSNYQINVIEVDMTNVKNVLAGNKLKKFYISEIDNYNYLTKVMKQAINQKRRDAQFKILARMRAVYNSIAKRDAAKHLMEILKGRKLFFCASIDQAEFLCNNTYHSKTNNSALKAFVSGDIDEVAMVNAGGVGTTFKRIDHLVMVQADSDNNGLTSQKICRTLLHQPEYQATIWILCLMGTQDEKWVESALQNFNKDKVSRFKLNNIKL